ncbi:hypothetical protein [Peribacillus kribbensis]|uniref:hypothetical protein n=1 Tax=Peribacillus kribbensis TaxID=356658 RepID=UPI000426AD7F|nr:hypothetical protein [Peribacillus kribbensis]
MEVVNINDSFVVRIGGKFYLLIELSLNLGAAKKEEVVFIPISYQEKRALAEFGL